MIGNQICRCVCALAISAMIPALASAAPAASKAAPNPLLRLAADSTRGAGLFQSRCGTCHSVQAAGPTKIGPSLHGLFGRRAGTLPDYNYSPAMRAAGIVWGAQPLDAYLTDPKKTVPGDKMPFIGLTAKADRDDIIAYLEQSTR
jgi:cytochrome c